MAKINKLDTQTGRSLRRLTLEQCERASQIYEALANERHHAPKEAEGPEGSLEWNAEKVKSMRGPARLSSPFENL